MAVQIVCSTVKINTLLSILSVGVRLALKFGEYLCPSTYKKKSIKTLEGDIFILTFFFGQLESGFFFNFFFQGIYSRYVPEGMCMVGHTGNPSHEARQALLSTTMDIRSLGMMY